MFWYGFLQFVFYMVGVMKMLSKEKCFLQALFLTPLICTIGYIFESEGVGDS